MIDVKTGEKLNAGREKSMTKLADALLMLMRQKRFSDISVSELCDAAGVARKTFYRNFAGMEDVVAHKLQCIFEDITQKFDITGATVKRVFEYVYAYILKNSELTAIFSDPMLYELLVERVAWYVEVSFNRELHNAVSFEPALSEYYTSFISVGLLSIVRTWLRGGCKQPPEAMARLTEHLLSGVIA